MAINTVKINSNQNCNWVFQNILKFSVNLAKTQLTKKGQRCKNILKFSLNIAKIQLTTTKKRHRLKKKKTKVILPNFVVLVKIKLKNNNIYIKYHKET